MVKSFLKIFLIIISLVLCFIAYFSLVGFETKSFNKKITENLKKIDPKLDVKLNDVKIILDLFNFKVNSKTLGPVISYDNQIIDIELIKSDISLLNLLQKEFSLSNLYISTKSIKLKDIVAFYRAINKDNKAELFILENFISKGYLIADIQLNFDDQGRVKDDLKISGFVRESSFNLLNKRKIDNINFIFETQNKDLNLSDLNFSYEKINFISKKIEFKKNDNLFDIKGKISNSEASLSEDLLKNIFHPFLNVDLDNIKFSSKNEFSIKINNKFKVSDYEIKSSLNLNELSIKNDINAKAIFPNLKSQIKFKDHRANIIFKNNYFSIDGNGEILIQKNHDKVIYKINKIKDNHIFDIKFDFINNLINFDSLNYKTNADSKTSLKLKGKFFENKTFNLEKIKFESGSDKIGIENLKLTNDFKISNFKLAGFDFIDKQNKKNIFQIKDKEGKYIISGKAFNASKLIEDLIFNDNKNRDIFEKNHILKINLNEVYLHDNHVVYDLTGNLEFIDNSITSANINSQFNDKEKFTFTIISNDSQKVTTLFSDQAKPFVKKFKFIKGFEKGSLDFYSIKSKNVTNSKLKIYDFNLKELPALTKILTLASLQGIADLLSGQGIGFSEFEMNFKNKNKLMTINEIYAIGPAISILMDGYIEKNKLVSLRGTLVPATTINKAIGSIPILGDILVGKKTGEGVFGVSFKIKGPPKKLETSVNPIKTLTPRFITRTIEKIKKN